MSDLHNFDDEQIQSEIERLNSEKENDHQDEKKSSGPNGFLVAFIILVIVGLTKCGVSALGDVLNSEDSFPMFAIKTWTVTKSTGLYDGVDPDSEMIASLPVGTKVRTNDTGGILYCEINDEGMTLCQVEVVGTGEEGWILKQWIE